eukprot:1346460-Amorphochlora_amoeboformis.AAC.1
MSPLLVPVSPGVALEFWARSYFAPEEISLNSLRKYAGGTRRGMGMAHEAEYDWYERQIEHIPIAGTKPSGIEICRRFS